MPLLCKNIASLTSEVDTMHFFDRLNEFSVKVDNHVKSTVIFSSRLRSTLLLHIK